jgi:peptidyl-tRNA hydrolase, PTH2 family
VFLKYHGAFLGGAPFNDYVFICETALISMPYKQVLLVIDSLKLPKGKMAAQCSHAAVEAVLKAKKDDVVAWRHEGMPKIVLKVATEKDLYKYIQLAKDSGLTTSIITDAGHTVVEPGTVTCGAIGPGLEDAIDRIVGELKLV